jgi:ADP-heptose:LPS heptosyltransferase
MFSHLCRVQKFLIIQTAFIGDVVLATSLIEKIHSFYPNGQIDFLLRKGNESLLKDHPFVHQILIWDKKKDKRRNLWKLLWRIRKEKYDRVINIQRFAATGWLTAFSGAAETIGFDKNPFSFLFSKKVPHLVGDLMGGIHEIERNQNLVKEFTDEGVCKPKLYPSAEDFADVKAYTSQKYITISPASVWFTKQYPSEKWISFIDSVPTDHEIYLLGAASDGPLCEAIKRSSKHKATVSLCGKLSFLQSSALMRDAVMNYVNDSAPMHFASAMNAPVTVVFCSTVPGFGFGPLSDIKYIVEIKEPLDCRPCGLHGYASCPEKHFLCAKNIADEQLLNTLTLNPKGF